MYEVAFRNFEKTVVRFWLLLFIVWRFEFGGRYMDSIFRSLELCSLICAHTISQSLSVKILESTVGTIDVIFYKYKYPSTPNFSVLSK